MFKFNKMVTPPKATFFSLQSRRTNLTAHTKIDRKLFQGRAENLNITNRAFSNDVTSDILVS